MTTCGAGVVHYHAEALHLEVISALTNKTPGEAADDGIVLCHSDNHQTHYLSTPCSFVAFYSRHFSSAKNDPYITRLYTSLSMLTQLKGFTQRRSYAEHYQILPLTSSQHLPDTTIPKNQLRCVSKQPTTTPAAATSTPQPPQFVLTTITNGKCIHTPTSPPSPSPPLVPGVCVLCASSPVFRAQSQPAKYTRQLPWDFTQSGLWKRRRSGETLDMYEMVVMPELKEGNAVVKKYESGKMAEAHEKFLHERVSDVVLRLKRRNGSMRCAV